MNEKIVSEGVCVLCDKTYKKSGINRHLKTHLTKLDKSLGLVNSSFLLKIETNPHYGKSGYFLYLWVNGNTKLEEIDDFLRAIWLECCNHLSSFVDVGKRNEKKGGFMFDFDKAPGEISMNIKANNSLYKGQKIEYTYDFGSSTDLLITVEESYKIKAPNSIVLLSRNEPLEIMCEVCKKQPATDFCIAHDWEEKSLFCKKCAKKHAKTCKDFEDYAAMPVVNSPRFGVCGYMGGVIDVERDGNTKQ